MYFFTFLAHPKPSSTEYGTVDGAYVNVWVDDPLEISAEATAREFVEADGWDIERREEAHRLAPDHYGAGDSGFEHMAQAHADGLCAVFHEWRVGAPDE